MPWYHGVMLDSLGEEEVDRMVDVVSLADLARRGQFKSAQIQRRCDLPPLTSTAANMEFETGVTGICDRSDCPEGPS